MKRNFKVWTISAVLCSSLLFSSCIGSYGLFNKVLAWNKTIGDKWTNELVFLACWIVPVYPMTWFVDSVILNTIEFWTGENPVAGTEIKTVVGTDGLYTVETSREGHKITKQKTGETVFFHFDEAKKTWSIEANGTATPLMTVVDDQHVIMHLPNGSDMPVTLDQAGVLAFRQVVMENTYFAAK
ncbi:MAG: DUF3332 domain-containing protein [Candidatus Azobacteroides sp.]|nr:DUF3332 domain-containing protein [Candidatus Azobacteroides sp.]